MTLFYVLIITSMLTGKQFEIGTYPTLILCERAKASWFLYILAKEDAVGECVERTP